MTQTLTGHFDGKVIVPDQPVDLPTGQPLTITVNPVTPSDEPGHGTIEYIMKHITSPITDEDAELMRRAIDEADTNFEPSPDINLD